MRPVPSKLVMPLLCLPLVVAGAGVPCAAKEWDLARAQYLSDAQIGDVRGPLRAVQEYHYGPGGDLESAYRTEYDRDGNKVRHVGVSYGQGNDCYDTTYEYSPAGDRIRETLKAGKGAAGGIGCRDVQVVSAGRFRYQPGPGGAPSAITRTDESPGYRPPDATVRYSFDPSGRLVRVTWPQPALVDFMEYAWGDDPRGTRLTRRSVAQSSNLKFDSTAVYIYAADGRLLETTQTPPSELLPPGDGSYGYDASGRLISYRSGTETTTYSGHDRHGNWTVSESSRGYRVTRRFEY
jgi:hypothetical protein